MTPTFTGRTIVKGTASFSAMEAELRAIHESMLAEQQPPEGWFSTDQYAKANGVSIRVANGFLRRGENRGIFKSEVYRCKGSRDTRPVRFYCLVKKAK